MRGQIGVNPDQRMHEETRAAAVRTHRRIWAPVYCQASILLVTFVGRAVGDLEGLRRSASPSGIIAIPGYMVWAAILYAGFGSLLSYWVGRSLIHCATPSATATRPICASRWYVSTSTWTASHWRAVRPVRPAASRRSSQGVLLAMRRLVSGLTNLTWVTAGFGWVTQVAPIIVAAPLYFQGTVSFGGLMMAAAAFSQAQSSLSWFVENFSTIADWRANLMRVASFRRVSLLAQLNRSVRWIVASATARASPA